MQVCRTACRSGSRLHQDSKQYVFAPRTQFYLLRLPTLRAYSIPRTSLQIPTRRTEHAQLRLFDQTHRDAFEHRTHRALGEEPLDERAAEQKVFHLRQDSTGQIGAALRAIQQHEVAEHAAEQSAKDLERAPRSRVARIES